MSYETDTLLEDRLEDAERQAVAAFRMVGLLINKMGGRVEVKR